MLTDYDHFRARIVQDALNEGLAVTWERRARAFLAARPQPGEFHGHATPEELRQRWHELTQSAEACRARAAVSRSHELIDGDVWEAVA